LATLAFPIFAGFGVALDHRLTVLSHGALLVGIAAFLWLPIAWTRFIFLRCPRCHWRFHVREPLQLTNGRRCPHCGLARYAEA
jgi:hypothetical protein